MHSALTDTVIPLALDECALAPVGPEEDPDAELLGTVEILGVLHHLQLYAVVEQDGEQVGAPAVAADFSLWDAAAGGDGPFATLRLRGREYVAFLCPYCG